MREGRGMEKKGRKKSGKGETTTLQTMVGSRAFPVGSIGHLTDDVT